MLTTAYGNPYNFAGNNYGYAQNPYSNPYNYTGGYAPSVVPNSVTSTGLGTVNPTNFNAPEVVADNFIWPARSKIVWPSVWGMKKAGLLARPALAERERSV